MKVIADHVKLEKDVIFKSVVDKLSAAFTGDDVLAYYNYTISCGDLPEDIVRANLLLTSPKFGVVFIIDEKVLVDCVCYFDNVDTNLYRKFLLQQDLRKQGRSLAFDITGLVLSDTRNDIDGRIRYVTIENLTDVINSLNAGNVLSVNQYSLILSCIDGTTKLVARNQRQIPEGTFNKGSILNRIQNKISCLDKEQRNVAMISIDRPQRIRGLAGSGKTILLTLKAARYHFENPDMDILYTYYTKDLYDLIRRLIERFYRDVSDNREPNWKRIHILHAWGGTHLEGVYSTACEDLGEIPIDYSTAASFDRKDPFAYICRQILEKDIKPKYDLTLIDEGQDFPSEFYQLCYQLTKDRRIVWAYDEFQNIFDVNLQDEKQTFGKTKDGQYYVDFNTTHHPLEDIILYRCYRTPREILIAAFSLGMGIYNEQVLQRLETNRHWELLGFKVEQGTCVDNEMMLISRPAEYTPISLKDEFSQESLKIMIFTSIEEECEFVANEIVKDITVEGLLREDICVICLDRIEVRKYYDNISNKLAEKSIQTFNMLNAANSNRCFSYKNFVTLATLNKAKGNECGMVYIIGVESVFKDNNNIKKRNMLFTAMTRSKGWVTLCGIGEDNMNKCVVELDKLKNNGNKLSFKQPSKEQTKTVMEKVNASQKRVDELIKELLNTGMSKNEIISFLERK